MHEDMSFLGSRPKDLFMIGCLASSVRVAWMNYMDWKESHLTWKESSILGMGCGILGPIIYIATLRLWNKVKAHQKDEASEHVVTDKADRF